MPRPPKPTKLYAPKLEVNDAAHKLTVPYTPDGQDFIKRLEALLQVSPLPFVKGSTKPLTLDISAAADAKPAAAADTKPAAASPKGAAVGSTAYTLDLKIDTEGWPP